MKHDLKITEDNYREVVLKRSIILCWILLAICFVIKIFGGNFFAIVCTNEKFIKVCEYINNSWIYSLLAYISFTSTSLLLLLIVRENKKFFTKNTILFWLVVSFYWIFKLLVELEIIKISVTVMSFIDYPILWLLLFLFTKKPVKSIFAVLLMIAFTFVSVFIKNIGLTNKITDSALVTLIFMIDYYIMLILTFLYSKKRSKV